MFNRIRRGLTANIVFQCFNFVEALGFVPLFLAAWGSDGYGNWLSLTAFLSYITLFNLGGQEYIANVATLAFASNDISTFKTSLSEGISLFAVICGAAFVALSLLLVLLWLLNTQNIILLDLSSLLILWLIGSSYLISIFGGVFSTTYRAIGRYARGMNIGNVWSVIRISILAPALVLQVPPLIYAFLIFFVTCVRTGYGYMDLLSLVPEFREVQLSFEAAKRGRRHLNGSLFFWLISAAGAINFQGTLLVVSANMPLTFVALFSTHRTASNLIRYPYTMLQGPTLPEVTRLWAEKDEVRLLNLIHTAIRLNATITGLLAVALWIWIPVLYALWTGRELNLDLGLLLLLFLQNTLYCGWATMGWVLLATNRHRSVALCDLFNAGTTIILAVLLIPSMGLLGVVLASLTGDIILGLIAYGYLFQRTRMISLELLYRSLVIAYLPAAIVFGLVLLLGTLLQGPLFVVISTLLLLVGVVLVLRLSLTQDQTRRLRQQLNLRAGFLARLL